MRPIGTTLSEFMRAARANHEGRAGGAASARDRRLPWLVATYPLTGGPEGSASKFGSSRGPAVIPLRDNGSLSRWTRGLRRDLGE